MAQKTRLNWKKIILLAFCVYAAVRLVYGFGEIYNLKQQKAQVDAQIEAAMTEQNNRARGARAAGICDAGRGRFKKNRNR